MIRDLWKLVHVPSYAVVYLLVRSCNVLERTVVGCHGIHPRLLRVVSLCCTGGLKQACLQPPVGNLSSHAVDSADAPLGVQLHKRPCPEDSVRAYTKAESPRRGECGMATGVDR
ncbi:hypothetical protein HPB50_000018 [Hyalomma asiaticum]|uniref:Uncharacterized protein n=1 Tax=Hyalomma asiaticum TaxID=266040 RepID=A0ACB7S1X9_HYAAI|nr:hypothetical protein HPB50_000018 [Hyalomma asiaticum]